MDLNNRLTEDETLEQAYDIFLELAVDRGEVAQRELHDALGLLAAGEGRAVRIVAAPDPRDPDIGLGQRRRQQQRRQVVRDGVPHQDAALHEMRLGGQGEAHLRIALDRLGDYYRLPG